MLHFTRFTIAVLTLGSVAACHSPKPPYLTGNSAVTTSGARNVDALWMVALPPVTVVAPRSATAAAPTDTATLKGTSVSNY